MNVNSIINHCTGLSRYELEDYVGNNFMVVYRFIESLHMSFTPNKVLVPILFTCIAADGRFTDEEWNFVMSFIGGYSRDEAFEQAEMHYDEQSQEIARKYVKMYPADVSEAFVKMCIGVLCVDGRVDSYESPFLNKLLS